MSDRHPARPPALPPWLGFVAAGLCFVAAGYLFTAAPTWSPHRFLAVDLPWSAELAVHHPLAAPAGLVLAGLALLGLAHLRPRRPAAWRAVGYPLAVAAVVLACGLSGSNLLAFRALQDQLEAPAGGR